MKVVKIVPVEGRVILMPDQNFRPVPEGGANVVLDFFYIRALQDGDIALEPEPAPAPAATEEEHDA